MKVGDLAVTHKGNLCIVIDVGICHMPNRSKRVEWYDIVFCSSGNLRTGYPAEWLRKHRASKT